MEAPDTVLLCCTAAWVSAYAMLARGMARELLPDELHFVVRWGVAFVRSRFGAR